MGKLIIIFLLLLCGVWLGWEIHQDSGAVMISFRNWQIETSVWLAVLLILITFIITYAVLRLIIRSSHWPRQWRAWRQSSRYRRVNRYAELAVCDLIEEKWATAEDYFAKCAAKSPRPLLYYLGAAIAAQEQGAHQRREDYLRQAYAIAPNAEITLAILQAKLQIQGQQREAAQLTLKKLQAVIPQHPIVKRLFPNL